MMEDDSPLLELRNISVAYNDHTVLDDLNLSVQRGEFVVLHGKTGCGKSTIFQLIAGLKQPTRGEIIIAGDRIDQYDDEQRRWLRRSMGIMLQNDSLLTDRTVLENIMLPALASDVALKEARHRAQLALNKCGIAELADARPSSLSAGQKQLACLARAVINHPVLILADEPVTHLDVKNAQSLIDLLGTFAKAGVTVLIASHQHLTSPKCPMREITLRTIED